MWRKIARVSGYMFAVALVIAYMCCASNLARKHRANQRVEKIIISLPDNSDMLNFTSAAEIIQDLEQNGFKVNNSSIGSIDAAAILKHIARLGYVKDVNAYVTYKGELYIDVRQHKPVLRLLSGGLNSYVSADGHIFRVPEQSVCYTPVVTGSYQPLFPCDYEGKVSSYYSELIGKEERAITELDNKLSALNKKKKKVLEKLSKAGRSKVDKYRDQLASLSSQEEALQEEKQKFENRKKKLQKKRTDFANLTNFVSEVGKDSFWSAEIVQCVADTTNTGEISLSLIPRSGDFVITFGTFDNRTEKLAKLRKFYDKGLAHVGWNRYKTVDVRYDKQIICKE